MQPRRAKNRFVVNSALPLDVRNGCALPLTAFLELDFALPYESPKTPAGLGLWN
jgi:hypothetical protein